MGVAITTSTSPLPTVSPGRARTYGHRTADLAVDLVLHLHGHQHDNRLAGVHVVAHRHQYRDDRALIRATTRPALAGPAASARRRARALAPRGATPPPAALAPLDGGQWRDPEVVAARYVLVDTNHPAGENPASVWARRATYASPVSPRTWRSSSSGAARLAELAAEGAVFQGEVIGLATVSRTDTTAVVAASVRRATALLGSAPLRSCVAFYRLTLARHDDGRWLVVDVEVT